MNIDIVDVYPNNRDDLREVMTGTIKVRLPDLGINLLGIYFSKKKNLLYLSIPGKFGTNHETGEPCRYPYFAFEDRERQKKLLESIKEKALPFIEDYIKAHPQTSEASKSVSPSPAQVKQQECKAFHVEQKKTASPQAPSSGKFASLASKEWKDVPKRPAAKAKGRAYAKR